MTLTLKTFIRLGPLVQNYRRGGRVPIIIYYAYLGLSELMSHASLPHQSKPGCCFVKWPSLLPPSLQLQPSPQKDRPIPKLKGMNDMLCRPLFVTSSVKKLCTLGLGLGLALALALAGAYPGPAQ